KYYKEVWEERNPEKIPELFEDNYVNHAGSRGSLKGPAGIRKNYDSLIEAFPDVRFDLEDILVEDDKVVVRYVMHGTHEGVFQATPGTGNPVTVPGIGIYKIGDGKIKESWVVRDSLTLLKNIGVTAI